jgi:hypothetical protein
MTTGPPMAMPADAYIDRSARAVPPQVVALARSGKEIQAIKLYRELTHADLKTAKKVVDGPLGGPGPGAAAQRRCRQALHACPGLSDNYRPALGTHAAPAG